VFVARAASGCRWNETSADDDQRQTEDDSHQQDTLPGAAPASDWCMSPAILNATRWRTGMTSVRFGIISVWQNSFSFSFSYWNITGRGKLDPIWMLNLPLRHYGDMAACTWETGYDALWVSDRLYRCCLSSNREVMENSCYTWSKTIWYRGEKCDIKLMVKVSDVVI